MQVGNPLAHKSHYLRWCQRLGTLVGVGALSDMEQRSEEVRFGRAQGACCKSGHLPSGEPDLLRLRVATSSTQAGGSLGLKVHLVRVLLQ